MLPAGTKDVDQLLIPMVPTIRLERMTYRLQGGPGGIHGSLGASDHRLVSEGNQSKEVLDLPLVSA